MRIQTGKKPQKYKTKERRGGTARKRTRKTDRQDYMQKVAGQFLKRTF